MLDIKLKLTLGGVDEAAVVVDDAGAHHALRPVAVEHDKGKLTNPSKVVK